MQPFRYERAGSTADAVASLATQSPTQALPGSGAALVSLLAGGTSQIDLMKEMVHRPDVLIDIKRLPLSQITALPGGGLRIGANVTNTMLAYHPDVQKNYPGLAEAILSGASPQIRNMASSAGNILQRTRCPYFRDLHAACNKREPGTGCAAIGGINRVHAVLGASSACIATHPSDMAVALAALGATVQVQSKRGTRAIPFADFHRLPGDMPQKDTTLEPDELITSLDLPASIGNSHYVKVREKASYAYALVSVAAVLEMSSGIITRGRVAVGSVAHKPWRVERAEQLLTGKKPDAALFRQVADALFDGAKTLEHNRYKIPMGKNAVVRCLMETSGLMPLPGKAGTVFAASVGGVAGVTDEGK